MKQIEVFSLDKYGDSAIIIDSGFVGHRLVVFEDPAYNISVDYLTEETYKKLQKESDFHKIYKIVPDMKRALQAILIAGEKMKEEVLNGTKKITIREGIRDYTLGPVILCCHILNWATMRNITDVSYKKLNDITEEEYKADGFNSQEDMVEGLKEFYPNITLESDITIVRWE